MMSGWQKKKSNLSGGENKMNSRDSLKSKIGNILDKNVFYFMMLPAIVLLIIFEYLPKFGLILAFKNYRYDKGILGSDWTGLDNFKAFFSTPDAWIITRNTLAYNLVFIVLGMVLAVTLAIVLNELSSSLGRKTYQTIMIMPYFLSYVIVAYLAFSFLGTETGILNKKILPMLGIEPKNWYASPEYWPFILVLVRMWKVVGYDSIVYLAAIVGIDQSYYEAAVIDGATKFQQIRYITIPCIKNMMSIMLIMAFGGIFNADFGLFYQIPMNSGLLKSTTDVLSTYIYNSMGDVGFSTAAGLYVSVVGFVMILISNKISKMLDEESGLF